MRHRVYKHFMLNNGWYCQFLNEDLKTPAARPITFKDPAKVIEMAERGHALKDLATRQALDYGINQGRGSVWLMLTPEQYNKLTRRK